MQNFAKSILNYFATYNETRFRFDKKIPYAWTNDEFTLNLCVFPEFEEKLLNAINRQGDFPIDIPKDQYRLQLDQSNFKKKIINRIQGNFDLNYLNSCLDKAAEQLEHEKPIVVSEKGEVQPSQQEESVSPELKQKVKKDGYRLFNLALRTEIAKILIKIQEEELTQLKEELRCQYLPLSSFNPKAVEQEIFDNLQQMAHRDKLQEEPQAYLDEIINYIQTTEFDLVMFDLYLMLNSYLELINTQSIFLFFHELQKEDNHYPIFFLEINIRKERGRLILESSRDILMINTPAINYFKFDNILTTPRACLLEEAKQYLGAVEQFLQAYYKNPSQVLFQPNFKSLVAEDLPSVNYRIGIQALEEDRKILDYSELITKLNEGAGQKFVQLITDYVENNVESTGDEVFRQFKNKFPRKSVKNLVSDVPMSLNDSQKRVLIAAKNLKNKIVKVEGPPGTGKSYTIAALVYQANLLNKSVLITSHKKQALDVVEEKLNQEFEKLHPQAKPSVLRVTTKSNLGETRNNFKNTLSSAVIGHATNRALEFNQVAVEKDRNALLEKLNAENSAFWENSENYDDYTILSFELAQLQHDLFGEILNLPQLPKNQAISEIKDLRNNLSKYQPLQGITWTDFKKLYAYGENLNDLIESCNRLNRMQPQFTEETAVQELNKTKVDQLLNQTTLLSNIFKPEAMFGKIDFNESRLEAIPDAREDDLQFDSYENLAKATELLNQLLKLNKGIKNKLFGSKERNQLFKSIKITFPQVYALIKQSGLESAHHKVEKEMAWAEQARQVFPYLQKDFLVNHKFRGGEELQDLKQKFNQLTSLEYKNIIDVVTQLSGKNWQELTFKTLNNYLEQIEITLEYLGVKDELGDVADWLGSSPEELAELYQRLKLVRSVIAETSDKEKEMIDALFRFYAQVLDSFEMSTEDISALSKLSADKQENDLFFEFLKLHEQVSHFSFPTPPDKQKIRDIQNKIQQLLEYQNDQRLKNLQNYGGDVQRILTAINTGKRITNEQAQILFNNLSCIIAPPELVSEYFPMSQDMVDMLIIDEASQVSIAQSISLMLRAEQTIVFGDELQYGAVSAVNVNKKYSIRYFKDILEDYERDRNDILSAGLKDRLASEVSENIPEDGREALKVERVDPNKKEWLKTFGIRTSTLAFSEAVANYKTSLDVHFRSFPEIISYSSEFFYKHNQINLITNRIRTKPINQTLRFIKVDTKGLANKNVNLDEIQAIKEDLEKLVEREFQGTIGVICSFKDQRARMEEILREDLESYHQFKRDNDLEIWFVGDVQGVERDIVYYSFVEDKEINNGNLRNIYPVINGTADNIRNLKKQRLNVGFSRAKDTMVFVHSMPLGKYSDTALGPALKHYQEVLEQTHDNYIEDEAIFDSPAEKRLYSLITQTNFYQEHQEELRLIPQFEIGKYIKNKYRKYIPDYRVDFLLTLSDKGKERSLIVEYDGLEFHFDNPEIVTQHNFDQEYVEYDIQRQLELEQYGYSFLRINKFNLMPQKENQSEVEVLNQMLLQSFD